MTGCTRVAAPKSLTLEVDQPPRPHPAGYREHGHTPGRLLVRRRWFSPTTVVHTLFALVWNGFLITLYAASLSRGGDWSLLFTAVHAAVGLSIAWWAAAGWLNRTVLRVEGGGVSCEHGPVRIPFAQPRPLRLSEVDFFEVDRQTGFPFNRNHPRWRVVARLKTGETAPIVTVLAEQEEAIFLRVKLERFLTPSNEQAGCW